MTDVSDEITARIRQKAAAEWPCDFDMQLHTIGEQAEASLSLQEG